MKMHIAYLLMIFTLLSSGCATLKEGHNQIGPCPDCIMIRLEGPGIHKEKEGEYYVKNDYTLRQFLIEEDLESYPRGISRIKLIRTREDSRDKLRMEINGQMLIENLSLDGISLKEGDILQIPSVF